MKLHKGWDYNSYPKFCWYNSDLRWCLFIMEYYICDRFDFEMSVDFEMNEQGKIIGDLK